MPDWGLAWNHLTVDNADSGISTGLEDAMIGQRLSGEWASSSEPEAVSWADRGAMQKRDPAMMQGPAGLSPRTWATA